MAIITKPRIGLKQFLQDSSDDLVSAVKIAARANVRRLSVVVRHTADVILPAVERSGAMARSTTSRCSTARW